MALGKGKKKNTTGTRPRARTVDAPAGKPGRKATQGGAGRGVSPKHAARQAAGAKTSVTRKAGPKKTRARTTTRSADK